MKIITHFIPEPQLEFGGHFLHVDKKTGLSEHGPFGKTDAALHPSQIRVGVVGTRSTVEMCSVGLMSVGRRLRRINRKSANGSAFGRRNFLMKTPSLTLSLRG